MGGGSFGICPGLEVEIKQQSINQIDNNMDPETIQNTPLQVMLEHELHQGRELYVHALVKSRHDVLTADNAKVLFDLYSRDGDKWLEVVRRLLANQFPQGFQLITQSYHFMRPVLSELYIMGTEWHRKEAHTMIKAFISQAVLENSNQCDMSVMAETLSYHIDLAVKRRIFDTLEDLLVFLSGLENSSHGCLSRLLCLDPLIENWKWYKNSVSLFRSITWLSKVLEQFAGRNMTVLQFQQYLNPVKVSFIQQNLATVVRLFGFIDHTQENFSTRQHYEVIDTYTCLVTALSNICSAAVLEDLLAFNQHLMGDIIQHFILRIDLGNLNRNRSEGKEILALNYQINNAIFSDTLTGQVLSLIFTGCQKIGSFYEQYLGQLCAYYKGSIQANNGNQGITSPLNNFLLKLCILSHPSLYASRFDELPALVNQVNNYLGANWNSLRQEEVAQTLRFFLNFAASSQGNSKLVEICIQLCMETILKGKTDEVWEDCHDIMYELPANEGLQAIVSSNYLPAVFSYLFRLPANHYKTLGLFVRYLEKFPSITNRSGEQIIKYLHDAFLQEDEALRYRNLKSSQLMIKILEGLGIVVNTEDEIPYESIEEHILPLLKGLHQPYNIDYEEHLLDLLTVLLTKHKHLTPDMCLLLASLPELYEKNEKKLAVLAPIYRAVSSDPSLQREINYEYVDLLKMLLQLAVDYMQHSLTLQEFSFYGQQISELFGSLQIFLQTYAHKIQEEPALKSLLINDFLQGVGQRYTEVQAKCISNQTSNRAYLELKEHLLHFMMTVAHNTGDSRILNTTCLALKKTPVAAFIFLHTVRMAPVVFMDYMLACPQHHEATMQGIVSFYEELRGAGSKKLERVDISGWREWPGRSKQYMEGVLREMKNRNLLDQVEYLQYLEALRTNYA